MRNKAQEFWDRQANRFDRGEKQSDDESRELIARTRPYLGTNDNVLDLGCATGNKTLKLATGIRHIHGLDISSGMISVAKINQNEADLRNVSFSQGTIFHDDLEEGSYDKIIAFAVIHLLEDSDKVIKRINDLLKPGGLFISATTCFRERMDFKTRLLIAMSLLMKRLGIFPLHLNMFKASDIEILINSQNFQIIKADKLFFNGMTIYFAVAEKM